MPPSRHPAATLAPHSVTALAPCDHRPRDALPPPSCLTRPPPLCPSAAALVLYPSAQVLHGRHARAVWLLPSCPIGSPPWRPARPPPSRGSAIVLTPRPTATLVSLGHCPRAVWSPPSHPTQSPPSRPTRSPPSHPTWSLPSRRVAAALVLSSRCPRVFRPLPIAPALSPSSRHPRAIA